MKPTKACATRTREFFQFSHTLSILPHIQSNGEKIQVQDFVFLTSELKPTHNFSLENMFLFLFLRHFIFPHICHLNRGQPKSQTLSLTV